MVTGSECGVFRSITMMLFVLHFLLHVMMFGVSSAFDPGDAAFPFSLDTLRAKFTYPNPDSTSVAVVVVAINANVALEYMLANPEEFLQNMSLDVDYVFTWYSPKHIESRAASLQEHMMSVLRQMKLRKSEKAARIERLHFATTAVSNTPPKLLALLNEWTSLRRTATVAAEDLGWSFSTERLDPSYAWLPPIVPEASNQLVVMEDPCALDPAAADEPIYSEQWVLVANSSREEVEDCTYTKILTRAKSLGAMGVMIFASPQQGLDLIRPEDGNPDQDDPDIPATMISHKAGAKIFRYLVDHPDSHLNVTFDVTEAPGNFFAIDHQGRLVEVGWPSLPTLMHLAWAAQYQSYLYHLDQYLNSQQQQEGGVLEVELFKGQPLAPEGLSVSLDLPAPSDLGPYRRVELDMQLSCPGTRDQDCPAWDHVMQLFVCCDDPMKLLPPCRQCDITPWLHMMPKELKEEFSDLSPWALKLAEVPCGAELGRWTTPFRRRVGHHITDITPLRGLLVSSRCSFQIQAPPWAGPWVPNLVIRFSDKAAAGNPMPLGIERRLSVVRAPRTPRMTPSAGVPARGRDLVGHEGGREVMGPVMTDSNGVLPTIFPLFDGGTFDSSYNSNRSTLWFTTPPGTTRALLVATITGHGSDDNNCAEFCPTAHSFIINGRAAAFVNYTTAGTPWGCSDQVLQGVVPNEHGTWWYGRNGWCDGQQVSPWATDVTSALRPPNARNWVQYYGTYNGKDPRPTTTAGYIMMQSMLVFYTGPAS